LCITDDSTYQQLVLRSGIISILLPALSDFHLSIMLMLFWH